MFLPDGRQGPGPHGRGRRQTGEFCRATRRVVCTSCFSLLLILFQRLSINVAAVPVAENMMDLIDGYCRLEKDTDDTVIYRLNKSELFRIIAHIEEQKCSGYGGIVVAKLFASRVEICKQQARGPEFPLPSVQTHRLNAALATESLQH